jgi:hypothetical protein
MSLKKIISGIGAFAAAALLYCSPCRAAAVENPPVKEEKMQFPGDIGDVIDAEDSRKYDLGIGKDVKRLYFVKSGNSYKYFAELSNPPAEGKGPLSAEKFNEFYEKVKKKYEEKARLDIDNILGLKPARRIDWGAVRAYFSRDFIDSNRFAAANIFAGKEWLSTTYRAQESETYKFDANWIGKNLGLSFRFNNMDGTLKRGNETSPDLNYTNSDYSLLLTFNHLNEPQYPFRFGLGFYHENHEQENTLPYEIRKMENILPMISFQWMYEGIRGEISVVAGSDFNSSCESDTGPNRSYDQYMLNFRFLWPARKDEFGGLQISGKRYDFGSDWYRRDSARLRLCYKITKIAKWLDEIEGGLGVECEYISGNYPGDWPREKDGELIEDQFMAFIDLTFAKNLGPNLRLEAGGVWQEGSQREILGNGLGTYLRLKAAF